MRDAAIGKLLVKGGLEFIGRLNSVYGIGIIRGENSVYFRDKIRKLRIIGKIESDALCRELIHNIIGDIVLVNGEGLIGYVVIECLADLIKEIVKSDLITLDNYSVLRKLCGDIGGDIINLDLNGAVIYLSLCRSELIVCYNKQLGKEGSVSKGNVEVVENRLDLTWDIGVIHSYIARIYLSVCLDSYVSEETVYRGGLIHLDVKLIKLILYVGGKSVSADIEVAARHLLVYSRLYLSKERVYGVGRGEAHSKLRKLLLYVGRDRVATYLKGAVIYLGVKVIGNFLKERVDGIVRGLRYSDL